MNLKQKQVSHRQLVPRKFCAQLPRRRGAVMILAAALMFVLASFLALSIDSGYVAGSRAELERTADAAAMAGCWEIYDQLSQGIALDDAKSQVRSEASQMASFNKVCQSATDVDASPSTNEITVGFLDSGSGGTINDDATRPYFAVEVTAKRSATRNGEVPFFFGRIFGYNGMEMECSATAVMARRVSGFTTPALPGESLNILPFALDQETWNNMLSQTTQVDQFRFDPLTGEVRPGSDGVYEVNLYPQGTGSPGNRGTVDIGGANNSTSDIARQIVHGISAEDLLELGKPLMLDAAGTMTLNGDTGISAGVKDELASIIGEPRIIPVFSSVAGNGNNANYTIVKWVGVRILDVRLTGKMSSKQVIIQPAPVLIKHAVPGESVTSSDFVLTPVVLLR